MDAAETKSLKLIAVAPASQIGDVVELPVGTAMSPAPSRIMGPGDEVEWTNASYLVETGGRGEIAHMAGEHAVIFNAEIALRHPHVNPYVFKRVSELRLARAARKVA